LRPDSPDVSKPRYLHQNNVEPICEFAHRLYRQQKTAVTRAAGKIEIEDLLI
jgi:hypothetical protein